MGSCCKQRVSRHIPNMGHSHLYNIHGETCEIDFMQKCDKPSDYARKTLGGLFAESLPRTCNLGIWFITILKQVLDWDYIIWCSSQEGDLRFRKVGSRLFDELRCFFQVYSFASIDVCFGKLIRCSATIEQCSNIHFSELSTHGFKKPVCISCLHIATNTT
jgi:hypothetical protein